MSNRFLLRDSLAEFPPYVPGKPPVSSPGLTPYKLSSNENHLPPLPGVVEAVASASAVPGNYPDPTSAALVDDIASHLGVEAAEVVPGAGASSPSWASARAVSRSSMRASSSSRLPKWS